MDVTGVLDRGLYSDTVQLTRDNRRCPSQIVRCSMLVCFLDLNANATRADVSLPRYWAPSGLTHPGDCSVRARPPALTNAACANDS